MGKYNCKVNISPKEVMEVLKREHSADLVHEELLSVGDDKFVGTLIFEQYYFRTSNRAALIVLIDNLKGVTDVRSIATGSSQGLIFNFDWGASDDFAQSVINILKKYTVK